MRQSNWEGSCRVPVKFSWSFDPFDRANGAKILGAPRCGESGGVWRWYRSDGAGPGRLVCRALCCVSRVGPATTSDPDFTSVTYTALRGTYLSTYQTLTTSSMGRRNLKTENIRSTFLMMFALSEIIPGLTRGTIVPPISQFFFPKTLSLS